MGDKNTLLDGVKTLAFIMSPRLGDALLAMIVVHNLRCNGYTVSVFSNYLYALRTWFPLDDIQPYPEAITARASLSAFDVLLHTYPHDVLFQAEQWHKRVIILDNYPLYRRCLSMVELQVMVCNELLGLAKVVRSNGLTPPPNLHFRQHLQRVVLHPTASSKDRYWLPTRFIKLAQQLQKKGYNPCFVVSPTERIAVSWIEQHQLTALEHPSLDAVARWLYESGWFIGSDSGIGHLASNLGIPTVSLMQRRKIKIRWRPNWAPGVALLPSLPLLTRAWKEHYWKYFISVHKVLAAFTQLTHRYTPKQISLLTQRDLPH